MHLINTLINHHKSNFDLTSKYTIKTDNTESLCKYIHSKSSFTLTFDLFYYSPDCY